MTKEQFSYLDKFGVGQIDVEAMSWSDIVYLQTCVRAAVSIIPFKLVEGMEDMTDDQTT